MTDRELLELAAKAAGMEYIKPAQGYDGSLGLEIGNNPMRTQSWNPLKNDGDALRLAVKLEIVVEYRRDASAAFAYNYARALEIGENNKTIDPYAATRRAIVRAAAEIGEEHDMTDLRKAAEDARRKAQLAALSTEHVTDGSPCWCNPELNFVDPDTKVKVWVHKQGRT